MRPTPRKFEADKRRASEAEDASHAGARHSAAQGPSLFHQEPEPEAATELQRKPEISVRFVPHTNAPAADPSFRGFDGRSRIICTSVSLGIFLIAVRAATIGWDFSSLLEPVKNLPYIFVSSVYDVLFATLLGLTGLFVTWHLRRRASAQRIFAIAFTACALIALLLSVLNLVAIHTVGATLNFRWLFYRSLFRNLDGRNAITSAIDAETLLLGLISAAGMLVLAILLRWLAERFSTRVSGRTIMVATLPALAIYLMFGHWYLATESWQPEKVENPVVALGTSLIESFRSPKFFTMRTPATPDDVLAVADRGQPEASAATPATRVAGVRNVVLFVMESVPAEMVEFFGAGSYNVTPNLNKYKDRSMVFRDIYAPAPVPHASATALLCSSYPWMSSQPLPLAEPNVPIDSIAARLRAANNARTAVFASGDFNSLGLTAFLNARGFDVVQDFRARKPIGADKVGAVIFRSVEHQDVYGSDDVSTAASCVEWIEQGIKQGDARPFFATVWTLATHEPYFAPSAGMVDYHVNDAPFNRFLNAMRHTDEAFGRIMSALEAHKLLDSTLVVVVSDRGQPFGKHSYAGQGGRLYDEDLRVPLIMINGRLFHGEQRKQVGSLVDVAPTVLDLLGSQQLPGSWQGHSLLDANHPQRAYFFSATSDLRFGCRDGNRKLIYDVTRNRTELFDLANDPGEQRNLAADHPDVVKTGFQRIAAWTQYQREYYDRLFGPIDVREPAIATNPSTQPTTQVADQR